MNSKKKSIIDTYNPIIYPVLLIVVKNTSIEKLNKDYSLANGNDITEDFLGNNFVCVTFAATRRSDKRKVIIVYKCTDVCKEDDLPLEDATHEGAHYVMDTLAHVGASVDADNQEPFCYLLQWAVRCIYTTLTKKDNGSKRKK